MGIRRYFQDRPHYRDPHRASVLVRYQQGPGGVVTNDAGAIPRVVHADSTSWNFSGDFTLEAVAVFTSSPGAETYGLIAHYNATSGQRSWHFSYTTGGGLASGLSTTGTSITLNLVADVWSPTLNVPYFLTLERSGTTVRIYRNGVVVDSGTQSGTLFNSSDALYIGAFNDQGTLRTFPGTILGARVTTAARYGGAHTPAPFPWPAS